MLSVLLFGIGNVTAQKAYDPEALIPLAPEVKSGTLPNGLKYYIRYNAKPEKKVELRMAVNAGSILEDDDQQGLAHFMEHMNFNGLEHFTGNELVHYLQSIGVEFGNDLNAYTGFDQTVYILPVPSDDPVKLEKAFQVIADWSGASLLTNEEIDKERGVILAESRLGKGADDRMMKKWLPELMNGSKYGERLPIGKDEIIEKFDYSALKRFHSDWYRPNLQAVAVVGDMPVEEAEKMIIDAKNQLAQESDPELAALFSQEIEDLESRIPGYQKELDEIKKSLKGDVKIKLKKESKGGYSWEVTGKDAQEILKANDALRKKLSD